MASAPKTDIRICGFADLDAGALYDLLKLRFDIFILEQQSSYPEIDGADRDAAHLIASSETGEPVGTLRITGLGGGDAVHIGRVAVRADRRGYGLGREMMATALAHIAATAPTSPVRLGAQMHLEGFYAGLGFRRVSGEYDDGGIPHIDMEKAPA